MKRITAANYRKDKLYPVVTRAVHELVTTQGYVSPVDLMLHTGRITKQQLEDWRFGRIPYFERVCTGNLSRLSRLLRILEHHARAMGLKPSQTVYRQWGKRGKKIVLRFSKSGEPGLEAAWSRHYVRTAAAAPTL